MAGDLAPSVAGPLPSTVTGLILALFRAIGETAPLIAIGALTYVPFAPDGMWSPFTVLPLQIFSGVSRPQAEFLRNAAGGIMVLLGLLLVMNGAETFIRDRGQVRVGRRVSWVCDTNYFGRRFIPPGGVANLTTIFGILVLRALPSGRIAAFGGKVLHAWDTRWRHL